MSTFHQNNQKISGNQYNIGGNAVFGEVPSTLQKLISEIENAAETNSISPETAARTKSCIKDAISETEKIEPNPETVIKKLNRAKALIEGVASAGGVIKVLIEVTEMVKKLFP